MPRPAQVNNDPAFPSGGFHLAGIAHFKQSAATTMETDPYSSPAENPSGSNLASAGLVSAAAVQQLAATKPWVRFISVMTFIGAGFMLLAAAGMVLVGLVGASGALPKPSNGAPNPLVGGVGFGLAAVYAIMAFIYIFPGVKLWKYGSSIGQLLQTGRDEDLVAALNQQRSFWKFAGIMMILIICLYILVTIGVVMVGAVAGFSAAKIHP
jgi:hypothetical protein